MGYDSFQQSFSYPRVLSFNCTQIINDMAQNMIVILKMGLSGDSEVIQEINLTFF